MSDQTYKAIESKLTPEQMVSLVAFAGLMVATNALNNALEVQLDVDFEKYRKTS